jgi:hypothetical protein
MDQGWAGWLASGATLGHGRGTSLDTRQGAGGDWGALSALSLESGWMSP